MATKSVLNTSLTAATWTQVVLNASFSVAQYMMRPRSGTATLKVSYETASDAARDALYWTIRPGECWTDSLVGAVTGKTVWVECNETTVLEVEMTVRGG